ncbi:MAG TPA: hypothetical protein DIT07_16835 [Sphingobacteriaceae bacterium]|nr:hypothetical protein [Sphingobacteriaceae bacterium]
METTDRRKQNGRVLVLLDYIYTNLLIQSYDIINRTFFQRSVWDHLADINDLCFIAKSLKAICRQTKLLWIIVILVAPVIGSLIYLLWGKDRQI